MQRRNEEQPSPPTPPAPPPSEAPDAAAPATAEPAESEVAAPGTDAAADGAPSSGQPAASAEPAEGAEGPGFSVRDRRFWAREAPAKGGRPDGDAGGDAGGDAEAGAAEPPPPRKPSYVESLEQQLAEKDERLKQYIEAHRQSQRQFDEARERLRRDVERQVERGRADLVARFFPVLDDLDRSLDASGQTGSLDALRDGLRIVHRQFLDVLAGLGLERFDPTGEPFDPNLHDALSLVPVADPAQDNVVQQVFRPGYRTGEQVLRHAVVLVGRCPSQSATPTPPSTSEE